MDQDNLIKKKPNHFNGSLNIQENGTMLSEIKEEMDPMPVYDGQIEAYNDPLDNSDIDENHENSVHAGIKPFECKLCDYKAARNFNLKHHIESVHQGIKAFKCNICGIETAQKSDLKKHIKFVHESKKNENYKKVSEASVVISNDVVVKKEKGTKYDDILESDENPNFQSIKVETFPLEQSKTSDIADPLLIHENKEETKEEIKEEIKEEVFENNEATPIYIKQEEDFDASGYQIVQENGMIVQEIKEESVFWE